VVQDREELTKVRLAWYQQYTIKDTTYI